MDLIITVIEYILLLNIIYSFSNAIYRVITERDRHVNWKIESISSIIAGIIYTVLLVGLLLGW